MYHIQELTHSKTFTVQLGETEQGLAAGVNTFSLDTEEIVIDRQFVEKKIA